MARKTAVSVENLEARSLLSGIAYSLGTDHSTYQVGQPIQITFSETNTGTEPVTVSLSPTDFSVSRNGSSVWESNPENAGQPPTSVTLQAGQSVSQTSTWDGTITETATQNETTTSYAVNQFGSLQVSNPNAPPGDTATFQITNPLQGAFTTDQAIYQLGQPVLLTYTETNTSDHALTISTANPLYQVLHDGQPMLPVMDPLGPSFQTITPGQTITDQYTFYPPGRLLYTPQSFTGAFAAQVYDVPAAPGEFTANFQIAPPPSGAIGSSVTTDQSVYQVGQTVTMSFTETNESDRPVTVPTGQNGFVFDPPSPAPNSSLESLPGPLFAGWSTLEPGQTWTQTGMWSVSYPMSGHATFQISNVFDLNSNSATFEVSGTSSSGSTSGPGNGNGGSSSAGSGASPITTTVTTNRADYKVGESVRISLKLASTGGAKAFALPVRSLERITVLDGTQVVSRMTRRIPAATLKHFEKGQAITLTTVWNGLPNQPHVHGLKPGSYKIDVAYGNYGSSTTIALRRQRS